MISRRSVRLMGLLAASALLVASCTGGNSEASTGDELSGSIVIDGSSTVEPLSGAIAEEYQSVEPKVGPSVATSGTGGGFEKFCAGEIDIANASRPIKDEEVAACKAKGIAYTQFRVGLDGLAVVTAPETDFVECLSFKQLQTVFKEGGAKSWKDVDPKFPEDTLSIFAPGTDSGTYDFFVEEVLGKPGETDSIKPRSDYTASEDDNTLIQGISGEPNSFGYIGFAYFQENKGKLKAIKVSKETGGECVAPTTTTVGSGSYALSRPLFIYVKNSSLDRPEVTDFVRFYLETAPEIIGEIGYVAAPQADYAEGLAKLKS